MSLGVFSDYQRAQRRFDEVRAIGLTPRIDDRKRAGSVYWIDVDLQEPGQLIDTSLFQNDPGKITRLEMRACPATGLVESPCSCARFLLDLVALALILVAPFVILLSFNGYSYSTPEVLLILPSALAVAALLALLLGFVGRIVRAVVIAALLALFIDVQVSLPPWSSVRHGRIPGGYRGTRALLCACASMRPDSLRHLRHAHRADSGARIPARIGSSASKLRPRAAAIPRSRCLSICCWTSTSASRACRRRFRLRASCAPSSFEFYTSRGFRLFGGAYSQYANTYNSIANLLNFAARDVSHPYLSSMRMRPSGI